MEIERSIDVEDVIRAALSPYLHAYCRPLPASYELPNLLVQRVGGSDLNRIDTFDVILDARAETEAEADEALRNAVGILKATAKAQKTPLRHVAVNSSGSWGKDPARPDLAMCSARLRVTAHMEKTEIMEV